MYEIPGIEELEFGIDSEASLNEELLTLEGIKFLDKYYDDFLTLISKNKYGTEESVDELDKLYKKCCKFIFLIV